MADDEKDKTQKQMKDDAGKAGSLMDKLSEKFKTASRDMHAKFNTASRNMDSTFKNSAAQKSVVTNDSTMSREQANQKYADEVRDSSNWQPIELQPIKKQEKVVTNKSPEYYNPGEQPIQMTPPTRNEHPTGVTPQVASPQKVSTGAKQVNTAALLKAKQNSGR